MAGELHVYFHSTAGGNANQIEDVNTKEASQRQKVKDATSTNEAKNKNAVDNSMIKSLIVDSAKKIAMNGISNIGNLTGNYQAQSKLQDAINFGATALQLMNWPVGTIATAVSLVNTGINEVVERSNQKQQIELLRERSGNAVNDDKGTQQ